MLGKIVINKKEENTAIKFTSYNTYKDYGFDIIEMLTKHKEHAVSVCHNIQRIVIVDDYNNIADQLLNWGLDEMGLDMADITISDEQVILDLDAQSVKVKRK